MAKLTEADKEALAALPDDAWFSPLDFYFQRPETVASVFTAPER